MPIKATRWFYYFLVLIFSFLVSGCSTRSSSDVTNIRPTTKEVRQVLQEKVALTDGDISDRPYSVLGDISVTVNKTTIFHADPTKEMVNEKLKEEAAKLGADAVILVRYGTVGISWGIWEGRSNMGSWGSLDGKGRAIQFTR